MGEGEGFFFGLFAIFSLLVLIGIAANLGWLPNGIN
jgi:hypothetical protein